MMTFSFFLLFMIIAATMFFIGGFNVGSAKVSWQNLGLGFVTVAFIASSIH